VDRPRALSCSARCFYALAPALDPGLRVFGVMLLVVVSCTWMVMIYLGAARTTRAW